MVEVKQLATYAGPNIYASEPVVVASLQISPDEFRQAPRRIPLVEAACVSWFAWSGKPVPTDAAGIGCFLVAWARAAQNELGAILNFGNVCEENGEIRLVLECETPAVTCQALILAAKIFVEIEKLSAAEVEKLVQEFWALNKRLSPDYQAQVLINDAKKRGIPYCRFVPKAVLWQYGWGARSEIFLETSPMEDSAIGRSWCRNKDAAKEVFARVGAPIAPSVRVKSEAELAGAREKIGFPCITKPADRGRSLGVTLDVRNWDGLVEGYRAAAKHSLSPIMVEKYIEGEVYRIMVIRGKLWRVIERARPFVVGDGKSTILALAEALYEEGRKKVRPGSPWKPAPVDEKFHDALRGQNVSPDDVPAKGARIRLRELPQMVDGGAYSDVTAATHPDVKAMSEAVAESFGIKVCGLDYITKDISKSCFEHGAFIEINTFPGVRIPTVGGVPPEELARAVLGDKPGLIPLVLMIAAEADHDRIRPHIPRDPRVGWICGRRSGIGGMEFPDAQSSFHQHLDRIIRNKAVEAVVAVCEMGTIAARGMPAPRAQWTVFIGSAAAELPAWTAVLRNHSERTVETSAIEELPRIIASALELGSV